jgi:O-antigen/teichoic acid export membrane protein
MSYVMHPYRPALCLRAWRGLTACSLWTWLLSLAVLLRDRADSLLIGRMLQVSAVGYFSVGAEIAALPSTELIEPMGRAAFSGFAAGRQEKADPGEAFLRLIGFAALLGLPAGVGLALVAAPVVRIAFGPGWTQAVPVLRILSLSSTIMVLGHLSLHLLSAYALLGRLVGMTLIGAAARLGLLLVLIPRWGLPGAAIAAGAAMLVEQGLTVATALCRFRVTVAALARETWRPVLSVFAMAAILTVMGLGWTDDTSPATLIAASLVGGAVYCGVLSCTWLSVGKPAGAEQDILRLLWRRIR